jgi:hypothetical protein
MKTLLASSVLLLTLASPGLSQVIPAGFYGDIDPAQTFDMKFTTLRVDTFAPATLAGSPVVSVYKDNNTTETATGVTLTVDFDSRTGLNNVHIDTSASAFYTSGSYFHVIITTGTVNSLSVVGWDVGSFSIGKSVVLTSNASSNINTFFDNGTTPSTALVGSITQVQNIQKGVAFSNYPIWMLTTSNGAVTGITPSCQIQKDAGAFAGSTNAVTEIGSGKYVLNLTSSETNANVIAISCTGSGAVTYRVSFTTQH